MKSIESQRCEKLNLFLLTISFLMLFQICCNAIAASNPVTSDPNLVTEEEKVSILERNDLFTGLNSLEGVSKEVKKINVYKDNTPFIHDHIQGKLWLVEIKNVRLKLKSAIPGYEDKYVRDFEALIDPNTGNFLKITSKYKGFAPEMRPEPNSAVAEKQLIGSREKYLGFPQVQPNITFLDALNSVLIKGVGSPFLAKEIDGIYVMHSEMNAEPRPVWVITLRGIPPLELSGPMGATPEEYMSPVWQMNHIRNIIDANSGEFLSASNIPQPEDPNKSK